MDSTLNRTRVWLLGLLIIFLPLSAWLVSWSGSYLVSLGRDVLLGLFVLASLLELKNWRRPTGGVWLVIAFTVFTLASYFVRQDSLAQWLRGVRYLIEPFILFAILQFDPLPVEAQKPLVKTLIASLIIVLVGAALDYFFPLTLHTTLHNGGRGFLGQIHLAGTLPRLQSTLAGPNALGLFLLVVALLTPLWQKYISRYLTVGLLLTVGVVLALTFSRSGYIGLFAGLVYLLQAGSARIPHAGKWLLAVFILGLIGVSLIITLQPQALTRFDSNDVRLQQYQRVWNERDQIGFWGRGAGTTGLVSEFSFDNTPNHFSENTYLDVYENIGLLGALAYATFWIWLIVTAAMQKTLGGFAVAAVAAGLVVAGIFIDHYTGQAALWLTLLFAGLIVSKEKPLLENQEGS